MTAEVNRLVGAVPPFAVPYCAVRSLGIGPVLVLAPHPDDEIFGCGGAIIRHVESGDVVNVVVVTGGGGGDQGGSNSEYIKTRRAESVKAAEMLGYATPTFLEYSDRGLLYGEELIRKIGALLVDTRSKLLYAPSIVDTHPDHTIVGMAAMEAMRRHHEPISLAVYEVSVPLRPNAILDITDVFEKKKQAMACFASQLQSRDYSRFISGLNTYRAYTLPAEVKAAEAYFIVTADEIRTDTLPVDVPQGQRPEPVRPFLEPGRMDLVTVVVRSTYRATLKEALDSLAAQTYPHIEVVLVDAKGDGQQPVNKLCGRFPVRVCGTGKPLNRAQAANLGLTTARGRYITFLDDDDMVDPDHIEGLVHAIESTQSDVVYCGARVLNQTRTRLDKRVFNEPFDRQRLLVVNYIPNNTILFSGTLFDESCRFDEKLTVYEDWDFLLQLSRVATFHHVPRVTATYRITDANGVGVHPHKVIDCKQKLKIYQKWRLLWNEEELLSVMERSVQFEAQSEVMRKQLRDAEKALSHTEAVLARIRAKLVVRVYHALKRAWNSA